MPKYEVSVYTLGYRRMTIEADSMADAVIEACDTAGNCGDTEEEFLEVAENYGLLERGNEELYAELLKRRFCKEQDDAPADRGEGDVGVKYIPGIRDITEVSDGA